MTNGMFTVLLKGACTKFYLPSRCSSRMTESLRRTAELLLSFKNSAKSSDIYFPSTSSASCSDSSAGQQSINAKKRLFPPATSNSKRQLDQSQSSTNTSPTTSAATSNTASEISDDEESDAKSNDRKTSAENRNFSQPKTSPSLHQYFPPNLPYEAEQFRRELYNKYGNPAVQLPSELRDSLRQLKNLLKLPKARRFVWSEFFYSDVDRELFLSDNDFRLCLRESFPALKARKMTKVEWQHLRRSIGKPRRCSQAFFDEERHILLQKRQRIRDIYKGTALSLEADLELPSKIPHSFVVGSRVVARIRHPKDGIFVGTVDAVMDGKYRIFFDKDILPPLVVDDSDLKSVDWSFNNLVPVSFFIEKNKAAQPLTFRCNGGLTFGTPSKYQISLSNASDANSLSNDPLLPRPASSLALEEKCGYYPLKSVINIAKLSKLIEYKRCLLVQLQQMNSEAERIHLYAENYMHEFQHQYAKIIIDLDQINKRIDAAKTEVEDFANKLVPHLSDPLVTFKAEELKNSCDQTAGQIMQKCCSDNLRVRSSATNELIVMLTSLLLQVRSLGQSQQQQHHHPNRRGAPPNQYDLRTLRERIERVKRQIDPRLVRDFEDHVEVHFKYIEQSMSENSH